MLPGCFFFSLQMMQYRIYVQCILLTWRQGTQYGLHLVQLYFIDVFELCTMICLHVSWHFPHVHLLFAFLFFPFFFLKKLNAMNINIFLYSCSICGKCLSSLPFLSKLESVIWHQNRFKMICSKMWCFLHHSYVFGSLKSPFFVSSPDLYHCLPF